MYYYILFLLYLAKIYKTFIHYFNQNNIHCLKKLNLIN